VDPSRDSSLDSDSPSVTAVSLVVVETDPVSGWMVDPSREFSVELDSSSETGTSVDVGVVMEPVSG